MNAQCLVHRTATILFLLAFSGCRSAMEVHAPRIECEQAIFNHFSSRISDYRNFAASIAARDYLHHKETGLAVVMSGNTNTVLESIVGSTTPPITICYLPMETLTIEPIVEYITRYNLCRIRDADNLFITGDKTAAITWLSLIRDNCWPLQDDCIQRIIHIQESLPENQYKKMYQPYTLYPPSLTIALRDLDGALNTKSEQAGPGYPPQGVGSPDP
jgi:hypothetical protein